MNAQDASDKYEQLVQSGKIKWTPVDAKSLDPWGSTVVSMLDIPVKLEIGDRKVGKSYILRVSDHPMVKYVDVYPGPQLFMFVKDEKHSDALHPDELLAWSLGRISGAKTNVDIDERGGSVMTVGGLTVTDRRDRRQMGKARV